MSSPNWPAIRAGIFAGESGGDYDALFGFSNRPGGRFADKRLRGMTVNQALDFANPSGPYAQWVKGQVGRVATPMGAYQIVGSTLRDAKDALGLSGNEMMDEPMQERLGQWIHANQGTGAWEGYRGPGDPNSVPSPNPYASMPDGRKGQEMYAPQPAAPPQSLLEKAAAALGIAPTKEEAAAVNAQQNGQEEETFLSRLSRGLMSIESPPRPRLSGVQGASQAQVAALSEALKSRGSLAEMYARKRMGG